jgi:hypothetical protein
MEGVDGTSWDWTLELPAALARLQPLGRRRHGTKSAERQQSRGSGQLKRALALACSPSLSLRYRRSQLSPEVEGVVRPARVCPDVAGIVRSRVLPCSTGSQGNPGEHLKRSAHLRRVRGCALEFSTADMASSAEIVSNAAAGPVRDRDSKW